MQRFTRSAFAARHDLPGWRIIDEAIESDFVAPTFGAAAAFVGRVAAAADAAEHHPDIELRYRGRVRIRLTTHAAHGLTDLDADLARTIDALAIADGLACEHDRLQRLEVAIDALDIAAVLPFWKALLGYVDVAPAQPGAPADELRDPLRVNPPIWFQQMDVARPQRNRVHLDVRVAHDVARDRITAAIAAGGRLLDESHARAFWVLADPEGNEACICTWQDRD
jgi:4a-hydroxytetrahydrobiopterin dehydratase